MPIPDRSIVLNDQQINRIMDAIQNTNQSVSSVRDQVSEIKGTVNAYASGLEQERNAREALGRKVDKHDEILRGDGTSKNPGLVEQIGDVRTMAEEAITGVRQIRTAIWAIGSPIAIALIVDVIMRSLPLLYGAK